VRRWVFGGGWIEIGQDRRDGAFARALDEGGQVWEGKRRYRTLEEVLTALDRGIADWLYGRPVQVGAERSLERL
jgi:hypothetical protein